MKQIEFEKYYVDSLTKNFQKHTKYLDYQYKVFFELQAPIYQQVSCLFLELYYPSITISNYILERLLKLALISKEPGLKHIPHESRDAIFTKTDKKYGGLILGNSIEQCKKENLITEAERNFLFDNVRELMRNGFSHADAGKIMSNVSDSQTVLQVNIANPNDIQELSLNPKVNPTMQYIFTEQFAKTNYIIYFDFIFNLMIKLEGRLNKMDQS